MEDGGGPSGNELQDQFPNHPALRGGWLPVADHVLGHLVILHPLW